MLTHTRELAAAAYNSDVEVHKILLRENPLALLSSCLCLDNVRRTPLELMHLYTDDRRDITALLEACEEAIKSEDTERLAQLVSGDSTVCCDQCCFGSAALPYEENFGEIGNEGGGNPFPPA